MTRTTSSGTGREAGRAARRRVPRRAHAAWTAPADRPDPVAVIEEEAAARLPELVPIRHGRMRVSPFAFFRGAAGIMAADLAGTPDSGLATQLCGDAHLSNFGLFAAPDRRLVFDVNDFDETHTGPWEWDVKRLAASLDIAGRERGFPAARRREAVLAAARGYRLAMRRFAEMGTLDVWSSRLDADSARDVLPAARDRRPGPAVRRATAKAERRTRFAALSELTTIVDGRLRFVSHPPLVVRAADLLPDADARDLQTWMAETLAAYADSLPADRRRLLDAYRIVDLARKVVGVGSVGTRAWIVLLEGRDASDPLVLQAKEAGASVLEAHTRPSPYACHGERVVQGQRLMQAASDILLGWLTARGIDGVERDFYVRQLWDGKASFDVSRMDATGLARYGRACGWTLARAHARAGDRAAIAGYLGSGDAFDRALAAFAAAYADQNEADFAAFTRAIDEGRLAAADG